MLVSRIMTFRSLYGKTFCVSLRFPKPLLRTMGCNSTVLYFEHFVQN